MNIIPLLVRSLVCGAALAVASRLCAVEPVVFAFTPAPVPGSPFMRDVWAEVKLPSGKQLRLPAYFAGDGRYEVRARAVELGTYELGPVSEKKGGEYAALPVKVAGKGQRVVKQVEGMRQIVAENGASPGFNYENGGGVYTPVGTNLAWAPGGKMSYYERVLGQCSLEGINWMRVWFVHWSRLNLDWVQEDFGASPQPGWLDLRVAESWDRLVRKAEDTGVYLQPVFQHHGQYATGANANWQYNPWNAENAGGFLKTPGEFFTSPKARSLTAWKYRYIVARWGYSPAIMAWELFNEVHWVDTIDKDKDVATVAKWHAEMAALIRSVDTYGHLVTTSTDDLSSAIYAQMDFLQPHVYAPDMITATRRFGVDADAQGRPIFHGEIGDDHMPLSKDRATKAAGLLIMPMVWSSVMGDGRVPAQTWHGDMLIEQKRLGELGAVARFVQATGIGAKKQLVAFSARTTCAAMRPLVVNPGQTWQRRPAPVLEVPTDGRESAELAEMPQILVGSPDSVADGFTDRVTLLLDMPAATAAVVNVAHGSAGGAKLSVQIDGLEVAQGSWPKLTDASAADKAKLRPQALRFPLPAGKHSLQIVNTGGQDWVDVASVDLGMQRPVISAVGKRQADFIALWIWRNDAIYSLKEPAPVAGSVLVDAVQAGKWRITCWNTKTGKPEGVETLLHTGGVVTLNIPALTRHQAIVLEKMAGE